MWWRRSPSRWPRALAILSAPRTGRVFQPPFSGGFLWRSIPRDSVCWGWVTCSSCSVRRRSAEACGTARAASGRLTARNTTAHVDRREPSAISAKLPIRLYTASGAACVRRGHSVPTASPCLALQACAGGVPGLEAPGIAARAGVRPGASVWLLRKPSESKRPLRAGAFAYRASFKTSVREPPQPPAMQHVAHGREIADHREVVRERMVHCAAASSRAAEIAVRANGSSLLSNSSRMNSTKIIRPAPAARAPLTQTGVEDHNLLHLVQLGQNIIRDHVHRFAPMHSEEDH